MITKASLLNAMNSKLIREETDIDEIIDDIILDLTIKIPALRADEDVTLIIDTPSYSFPLIRKVDMVSLDTLLLKRIDHDVYIAALKAETQSAKPTSFSFFEGKLYLTPTPDAVYPCSIYPSIFANDGDDIDLPDLYRSTLQAGINRDYLISIGLGSTNDAVIYDNRYKKGVNQIIKLRKLQNLTGETAFNR